MYIYLIGNIIFTINKSFYIYHTHIYICVITWCTIKYVNNTLFVAHRGAIFLEMPEKLLRAHLEMASIAMIINIH